MTAPAYRIVAARAEDVERLPAIERAAAALFPEEDLPEAQRDSSTDVGDFERARREARLWVALDARERPVGFALLDELDGVGHLEELDVHPDHGRQGLGRRLLEAALDGCRARGHAACTLTTFAHLAWNAPFYVSAGFRVLGREELSPGLAACLEAEARQGLDPTRRVAMRRELVG